MYVKNKSAEIERKNKIPIPNLQNITAELERCVFSKVLEFFLGDENA